MVRASSVFYKPLSTELSPWSGRHAYPQAICLFPCLGVCLTKPANPLVSALLTTVSRKLGSMAQAGKLSTQEAEAGRSTV